MDDWAVNPIRPRSFSRAADVCDNIDFPGTSSRRTQLFTFQRAGAKPQLARPIARVHR